MKTSRMLGSAVVLGVATVVVLYLLLHVLRPDHNPTRRFLSEYAVGRFGVLMTASFLLQALMSLALVIGLFRDVRHSGSLLVGCAFPTVAAVTLAVAGVFPTDLSEPAGDRPRSTTRAGMVSTNPRGHSVFSRALPPSSSFPALTEATAGGKPSHPRLVAWQWHFSCCSSRSSL